MQVKLLDFKKLSTSAIAARTCWNSFHKGGNYKNPTDSITDDDIELLNRLVKQYKHESIIEHIDYTFALYDIPRYVLVELTRHRIASYSVKSTRYTLKEINTKSFESLIDVDFDLVELQRKQFDLLKLASEKCKNIDTLKALIPESYKCDIIFTINARSLRNFLSLRLSKAAHFKIRELAKLIYDAIPDSHKFLYSDLVI